MANHVIRDRVWDSKKLRRCSRDAALAYPTIFLVADDWGRFEFDPPRIWSKAFGGRRDITEAEVVTWLAEYEREELLMRYGTGGDLAVWTGFKGRPPSKRRPSDYPDPKDVKTKRGKVPRRKASGTSKVPSGYPLADQESRSGEQSRSGEPPPPAVAVGPVVPPWPAQSIDDYRELRGHMPAKSEGRIPSALKALVDEYGWPRVRPAWRRWLISKDARYGPEWFAGNFLAVESGPPARAAPTNERANERLRGMNAMIRGGLREGRDLGAGDEGAGGDLPGPGPAGGGPGDPGRRLPPGAGGPER